MCLVTCCFKKINVSVCVYVCVYIHNFYYENLHYSKKYKFTETENLVSRVNLIVKFLLIFILDLHPNEPLMSPSINLE